MISLYCIIVSLYYYIDDGHNIHRKRKWTQLSLVVGYLDKDKLQIIKWTCVWVQDVGHPFNPLTIYTHTAILLVCRISFLLVAFCMHILADDPLFPHLSSHTSSHPSTIRARLLFLVLNSNSPNNDPLCNSEVWTSSIGNVQQSL